MEIRAVGHSISNEGLGLSATAETVPIAHDDPFPVLLGRGWVPNNAGVLQPPFCLDRTPNERARMDQMQPDGLPVVRPAEMAAPTRYVKPGE